MSLNPFLPVLLDFMKVTAGCIRDKAAVQRRGKYCGGPCILGYDVDLKRHNLLVHAGDVSLFKRTYGGEVVHNGEGYTEGQAAIVPAGVYGRGNRLFSLRTPV